MARAGLLAVVLMMAGCGRGKVDVPPEPAPTPRPEPETRGDHPDLDALHKKSRRELVSLDKDSAETVGDLQRDLERGHEERALGSFRLLLTMPVWDEAVFTEKRDLSLPSYARGIEKDEGLARHLMRMGDLEAARRLANPEQVAELQSLHARLYDRNHSVEWSRLVARMLQQAELRILQGKPEAIDELKELHSQLRSIFSEREASTPLAASLLSRGRSVLQALAASKVEAHAKLASKARTVLDDWGAVRMHHAAVWPGVSRQRVQQLWGTSSSGRTLTAVNLARALDTSELPIPRTHLEGLVATFDEQDRLSELIATYGPTSLQTYPRLRELAHGFEERVPAPLLSQMGEHQKQSLDLGDASLSVHHLRGSRRLGGVLILHPRAERTTNLPREFGPLSLDASFEENRLRTARGQLGERITLTGDALAPVGPFLGGFPLAEANCEKAPGGSTSRLVFKFASTTQRFHDLATPLWGLAGFGSLSVLDDSEGGHQSLEWKNQDTSVILRVPNRPGRPTEVEVRNLRSETSASTEAQRRQDRLSQGKPLVILPRVLEPFTVKLGMTHQEVESAVPGIASQGTFKRRIFKEQPGGSGISPRQLTVRFDASQRVAEIRVLLTDRTGKSIPSDLLAKHGKALGHPSPWAGLWPDQAARAERFHWEDDLTSMTIDVLAGQAEWVLRDRPRDPGTASLSQWVSCSREVDGCRLGMSMPELEQSWKGTISKREDSDPLVLIPQSTSENDAVFVWLQQGKVSRMLARRRLIDESRPGAEKKGKQFERIWNTLAREMGLWQVGWLDEKTQEPLGWADDRTAVRLYWREEKKTPRLFVEVSELRTSGR